jgi:hypothetical protein
LHRRLLWIFDSLFLSLQCTSMFASLILKSQKFILFLYPSSLHYRTVKSFFCLLFYLTRTYDSHSWELEQLASRNDGYKVWFQYVSDRVFRMLYMTQTHTIISSPIPIHIRFRCNAWPRFLNIYDIKWVFMYL